MDGREPLDTGEAARDARRRALRSARQKVVDHRIEQLDLLRERLGALSDAVEPKEGREDEVAQTLKDIHGRIEKLAAILETG